MRYLFIFISILLFTANPVSSQSFEWSTGTDVFFDNREYNSIDNPQTIFGERLWGEAGANLGEGHRMSAGLNYLYEFGSTAGAYLPNVTMYYQYKSRKVDFHLGAFPRKTVLDFPNALLSDTLLYYRPNVEGLSIAYRGDWGHQYAFLDWTSRQSDVDHERFIMGISGRLKTGVFFLDHYLMMAHLAGKAVPDPDFHLRDNGGLNINLGIDLSEKFIFDSLCFRVGSMVSLDRTRGLDNGWQTPAGFLGQFEAFYKALGIRGMYYRGQGHTFFYGDPFYKLKQYGRLDFYVMPFRREHIKLKIGMAMHFAESQIDYSQQVLLSVDLSGHGPARNSEN
jgi:hypothetical protein